MHRFLHAAAVAAAIVAGAALAASPALAVKGGPKNAAQDADIDALQADIGALLLQHARLVFVTEGAFTGNLVQEANDLGLGTFISTEGLDAGDAICQDEAEAAGLVGTFNAWLNATSGPFVSDRLTQSALPYILVDTMPIADNFADLIDGNGITNPIDLDAAGGARAGGGVWTNVLANGGGSSGGSCSDWSGTVGNGKRGVSSEFDGNWTQSGTAPCENLLPLYCFQQ